MAVAGLRAAHREREVGFGVFDRGCGSGDGEGAADVSAARVFGRRGECAGGGPGRVVVCGVSCAGYWGVGPGGRSPGQLRDWVVSSGT